MNVQIYEGTPVFSSKTLCVSCRNGHVCRGLRSNQEIVRCSTRGSEPFIVPFPVVQCNDYEAKNTPSFWELKEIAWKINADVRHPAGFKVERPKKSDDD